MHLNKKLTFVNKCEKQTESFWVMLLIDIELTSRQLFELIMITILSLELAFSSFFML